MEISESDNDEDRLPNSFDKLSHGHFALEHIWTVVKPFLALANTHGSEFISHDHWQTFVPTSARDSLLSLTKKELVSLPLGNQGEKWTEQEMNEAVQTTENKDAGYVQSENWMDSYLKDARSCYLENLDVLTPMDEALKGFLCVDSEIVSESMSEKKSHEVEVMSQAVATLFHQCRTNIAVDLGSGKGYLSCELARHYKIPVVGLDCQQSNTHSAMQRDQRLGKRWKGLERRKRLQKSGKTEAEVCKTNTSKDIEREHCKDSDNATENFDNQLEVDHSNCLFTSCGISAVQRQSTVLEEKDVSINACSINPDDGKSSRKANKISLDSSDNDAKQDTLFSQTHSSILTCPSVGKDSSPISIAMKMKSKNGDSKSNEALYVPLTLFIQPDVSLAETIRMEAGHLCEGVSDMRILLTGLHTCGSLAVTSMKVFVNDPDVLALCCVGCCYQLMEEAVLKDPQNLPTTSAEACTSHFPLSQLGKRLGLHLGRNARNLGSQSVHRIKESGQLQGTDFYWRALLDVLLREQHLEVPEGILGLRGLKKRSKTFSSFVEAAFTKLNLPTDKLNKKYLEDMEEKHARQRDEMTAFFQLKLTLAPAIEALILMDRYVYLLEQKSVRTAKLVRLFDPLTSPRCYAFLAWK